MQEKGELPWSFLVLALISLWSFFAGEEDTVFVHSFCLWSSTQPILDISPVCQKTQRMLFPFECSPRWKVEAKVQQYSLFSLSSAEAIPNLPFREHEWSRAVSQMATFYDRLGNHCDTLPRLRGLKCALFSSALPRLFLRRKKNTHLRC